MQQTEFSERLISYTQEENKMQLEKKVLITRFPGLSDSHLFLFSVLLTIIRLLVSAF